MHILKTAALGLILAGPAAANVVVTFNEGAPKDRFTFANLSECTLTAPELTVDLQGSAAGLIFDVTGSGAGVEVFQPFELVSGQDSISVLPAVADGDTQVSLTATAFAPNQKLAFTIDVDDTAGTRAITVSRSEIAGATAQMVVAGEVISAPFDTTSKAILPLEACPT